MKRWTLNVDALHQGIPQEVPGDQVSLFDSEQGPVVFAVDQAERYTLTTPWFSPIKIPIALIDAAHRGAMMDVTGDRFSISVDNGSAVYALGEFDGDCRWATLIESSIDSGMFRRREESRW